MKGDSKFDNMILVFLHSLALAPDVMPPKYDFYSYLVQGIRPQLEELLAIENFRYLSYLFYMFMYQNFENYKGWTWKSDMRMETNNLCMNGVN